MLKSTYTFTLEDYKRAFSKSFFWVKSKKPKILKLGVFWWLLYISLVGGFFVTYVLYPMTLAEHIFLSGSQLNQTVVDLITFLFRMIAGLFSMGFFTVLMFVVAYVVLESKTRHVVLRQVINRKHELTLDEFRITIETDIIKLKFKKEDVRAIKLDKDFLYIFTTFLGLRVIPIRAVTSEMKEFLLNKWTNKLCYLKVNIY